MTALTVVQAAATRLAELEAGLSLPLGERLVGVAGVAAMLGLALLLSSDRGRVRWRLVAAGLLLQFLFGVLVLKTGAGREAFDVAGQGFNRLIGFTRDGARFVFGDLVDQPAFLAFSVLPTIIFFSALMSVLYHLGVMQLVVKGIAW